MPLLASNKEGEQQVRRMFVFVGLSMLLIVAAAGIAVAVNKTCGDNLPCRGTENDDSLHERQRNGNSNGLRDRILALDGKDTLDANNGTNDKDVLEGGKKDDILLTNDRDGRDNAKGGRGSDRCVADAGDRVSSCRRISPTSAEGMALTGEASNAGASGGTAAQ
jgi:hypothetical protein